LKGVTPGTPVIAMNVEARRNYTPQEIAYITRDLFSGHGINDRYEFPITREELADKLTGFAPTLIEPTLILHESDWSQSQPHFAYFLSSSTGMTRVRLPPGEFRDECSPQPEEMNLDNVLTDLFASLTGMQRSSPSTKPIKTFWNIIAMERHPDIRVTLRQYRQDGYRVPYAETTVVPTKEIYGY
jgi:hypothetical protein